MCLLGIWMNNEPVETPPEDKAEILQKMRVAMACCCSEHRHKLVNKLIDQLEELE